MKTFALTPADAWFFRDGRPYNAQETNQADVPSVFPPSARTLSGALRAALAQVNGGWTPHLDQVFGSGPNDLGNLQFTGPFLIKDGQTLWPLPRHMLGRTAESWQPVAFLRPDEKITLCDAGERNLPVIALPSEKSDGLKPAETSWITSAGLSNLLGGILPAAADIFSPSDLWAHEPRVGLVRDEKTLTPGEGARYSPAYVRLKKGVSLGVGIAGVPNDLKADIPPLFPLGGESRLAQCDAWPHSPLPAAPSFASIKPDTTGRIAFVIILLTPGAFKEPSLPGAEIISACVGKPQFIGGWDSLKREPLPLQPFAPAGSVWFCKVSAADFLAIHEQHGKYLGTHSAHGFGQILIGHWPQSTH